MKRKMVTCISAVIVMAAVSLEEAHCSSASNGGMVDLQVQFPDSEYPHPKSLRFSTTELLRDLNSLLEYQRGLFSGEEISLSSLTELHSSYYEYYSLLNPLVLTQLRNVAVQNFEKNVINNITFLQEDNRRELLQRGRNAYAKFGPGLPWYKFPDNYWPVFLYLFGSRWLSECNELLPLYAFCQLNTPLIQQMVASNLESEGFFVEVWSESGDVSVGLLSDIDRVLRNSPSSVFVPLVVWPDLPQHLCNMFGMRAQSGAAIEVPRGATTVPNALLFPSLHDNAHSPYTIHAVQPQGDVGKNGQNMLATLTEMSNVAERYRRLGAAQVDFQMNFAIDLTGRPQTYRRDFLQLLTKEIFANFSKDDITNLSSIKTDMETMLKQLPSEVTIPLVTASEELLNVSSETMRNIILSIQDKLETSYSLRFPAGVDYEQWLGILFDLIEFVDDSDFEHKSEISAIIVGSIENNKIERIALPLSLLSEKEKASLITKLNSLIGRAS